MEWHENVDEQLRLHEKAKAAEQEKRKAKKEIMEMAENLGDDEFFEMQRDKMSKQVSFMQDQRQSRTVRA